MWARHRHKISSYAIKAASFFSLQPCFFSVYPHYHQETSFKCLRKFCFYIWCESFVLKWSGGWGLICDKNNDLQLSYNLPQIGRKGGETWGATGPLELLVELRKPPLPTSTGGFSTHLTWGNPNTHTHTHTPGNNVVSSALAKTQGNDHRDSPANKMSTTAVPPPVVILKDKEES